MIQGSKLTNIWIDTPVSLVAASRDPSKDPKALKNAYIVIVKAKRNNSDIKNCDAVL
jgi:hypothetical protein